MIQAVRTDAVAGAGVVASDLPVLRQATWWAGKAFWAVLDQGLFASSNFVLGVLLARWLSPEQFGSFAVAQSTFLLAGTLHAGLFSEPMMVFGSARHAKRFPAYLDILLHAHWRLAGLGSLLLVCVALGCRFFGSRALAGAFFGVALASPFILFGWLVRRACLSRLQPQWAAIGGALYFFVLLTGSYALWVGEFLSPFSALALLGGAGLVSGLWILGLLRRANVSAQGEEVSRTEVFRDHWTYGRWAVASSGLSWIPSNLYYVLLPAFAGLEATAALRAVSNLVLPVIHFQDALISLILPALASAALGKAQFKRLLAVSLTLSVGGSLLYWACLTVFRGPILEFLYHGAYGDTAALVPFVALFPIAAALIGVLGSALRALEQPQSVFWAYVASTFVTITIGIWATSRWGVSGAVFSFLLSSAVSIATCGAFLMLGARRRVEWT